MSLSAGLKCVVDRTRPDPTRRHKSLFACLTPRKTSEREMFGGTPNKNLINVKQGSDINVLFNCTYLETETTFHVQEK